MDMTDDERRRLAARVAEQRGQRFGTKVAAYQAAGLNGTTWGRIEAGRRVRDDRLRAAVQTLWPDSGGDWRHVGAVADHGGSSASVPPLRDVTDAELLTEVARRLARVCEHDADAAGDLTTLRTRASALPRSVATRERGGALDR